MRKQSRLHLVVPELCFQECKDFILVRMREKDLSVPTLTVLEKYILKKKGTGLNLGSN